MKIFFMIILSLNVLLANEVNTNIVKTSELELFLFKVGFESLLKDVDTTKNKTSLNESEIEKLKSNIEIIMEEVYKNKKVLKIDSSNIVLESSNKNDKELKILKEEIQILKTQMKELISKNISKKTNIKEFAIIRVKFASIRKKPFSNAQVLYKLKKGNKIYIEFCDKYGWCKLKNENKYIARYMFNL